MKRLLLTALAVLMMLPVNTEAKKREKRSNVPIDKGYYKDVFMDGGIYLTSRKTLPAADALGLSMEFFASAPNKELSATDTLIQTNIMVGNAEDTNGWLLYPDGAPRYRMIYMNGGRANRHAISLTKAGCGNIVRFVSSGGSYVGTCAGAFLASGGSKKTNKKVRYTKTYLHLWPGIAHSTSLSKSNTDMRIEPGSPLLRYYDFGGDGIVSSVRHNGGCYALDSEKYRLPAGTEPLARYIYMDNDKVKIDDQISIWAYKSGRNSGRAILCGSHPEGVKSGERRDLMASMLLYAMDGNAAPKPKAELVLGAVREMNKFWEDEAPAYTAIGDRQYHHFTVTVPKKCKSLTITLKGYDGKDNFDLTLCANPKKMAFVDNSLHIAEGEGCNKQLTIRKPRPGKLYISVFCNTTVTATDGTYGTSYSGRTDVLNGVPYSIVVE